MRVSTRHLESVLQRADFEALHGEDVPVRAQYLQVGRGRDVVIPPQGRQEFQGLLGDALMDVFNHLEIPASHCGRINKYVITLGPTAKRSFVFQA